MIIARFILDVAVCLGLLAALPKLLGTFMDLISRISGSINALVRRIFRLDDDRAWGMDRDYKDHF